MEEINKRHIELPSTEGINDLTPQDQLIYLGIRSFMNRDTLEAFPSQQTVAERIGCCDKTVRKCVKNLIDKKYIEVRKEGKKIIYKFNKFKQFEPFSYEFIEDKTISFTQKALLASTQQYMYDKESGTGKISYSKMELAEKINMPYSTLVKATRELARKEIVEIVKLNSKDEVTGCNKQQMQFNLEKYHQGIVKVLLNYEERIENNEEDIAEIKAENVELKKKYLELESRLNRLENSKEEECIILN